MVVWQIGYVGDDRSILTSIFVGLELSSSWTIGGKDLVEESFISYEAMFSFLSSLLQLDDDEEELVQNEISPDVETIVAIRFKKCPLIHCCPSAVVVVVEDDDPTGDCDIATSSLPLPSHW